MTPSDPSAAEPAPRLEALERRARAATRLAAAALGLALFLLLVQAFEAIAPPPPVVAADAFVLRDIEGVERARLEQKGDEPPALVLADAKGRARLSISLGADGAPSVLLRDQRGTVRAGLALLPDERPQLALVGGAGPPQVLLGVGAPSEDGARGPGRLILRDGAGEPRFEAP